MTNPSFLDAQTKSQIIHDIRASSSSYVMMVEEIAFQLKESHHDRDQKKIAQIRRHEAINKIITDLVVKAIVDAEEMKDPS